MKKSTKRSEVDLARRLLKRVGNYEMRRSRYRDSWVVYKNNRQSFFLPVKKPVSGTSTWIGLLEVLARMGLRFKFDKPSWCNEKLSLEELDFYLSLEGF